MANEVGGLLDGFLKLNFDYKGLAADPGTKQVLRSAESLLAKYTTSPMNIDDPLFDNLEKQIEAWLDTLKANQPNHPIVGAMALTPAAVASAQNYMRALAASQGKVFSQEVINKVASHPDFPHVVSHRTEEQQGKIMLSPWLDKIIGWIEAYGPLIAQFLMILVPLL